MSDSPSFSRQFESWENLLIPLLLSVLYFPHPFFFQLFLITDIHTTTIVELKTQDWCTIKCSIPGAEFST